jgi:hypothetical protein
MNMSCDAFLVQGLKNGIEARGSQKSAQVAILKKNNSEALRTSPSLTSLVTAGRQKIYLQISESPKQ